MHRNKMSPGDEMRLEVELHGGGEIFFEGKEISLSEFKVISKTAAANDPNSELYIKVDKVYETEDLKTIVQIAVEEGLNNVVFGVKSQ